MGGRLLINPKSIAANARFSAAVQISEPKRWLFISGQTGRSLAGEIPDGVEAQAELAWRHVIACLEEVGMTLSDLVETTTYLVGRECNEGFDRVRSRVLGDNRPASTKVFVSGLADPRMLCEIQARAAV